MNQTKYLTVRLTILIVSSNHANARSGYDLFQDCENGANQTVATHYQDSAYCDGFLSGVWNTADAVATISGTSPLFCAPQIKVGQLSLIYRDWARRNPQYLNRGSAESALAAFSSAFPCSTGR